MKISDLSGAPAFALNFSAAASFGTTIFGPKLDGARFWCAHLEQFQIVSKSSNGENL